MATTFRTSAFPASAACIILYTGGPAYFNKKFKRTPSFKYVQLGMDYNHFNKKHMDIRILGPYRIVD